MVRKIGLVNKDIDPSALGGGIDAATLAAAIAAQKLDDHANADDNTDNNVTITRHGLCPKLSNVVTEFLNGEGGWTTPAGGSTREAVRVYKSANQSIPDSTWTTIEFDLESFDDNTMHDNVINNSRLVCKTAGVYVFVGIIVYDPDAVGLRYIQMRANGGAFYVAPNVQIAALNGDTTVLMSLSIFELAVDDYVELRAYQTSGGALDIQGGEEWYTSFGMYKVGDGGGGGGGSAPDYPHVVICRAAYTGSSGTWTFSQSDATQYFTNNTADADGDYVEYEVWLAAGTYKMEIYGIVNTSNGIVDTYVEGVEVNSHDWYNAGLGYYTHTFNFTVAASGAQIIKFILDGKNGGSGGYEFYPMHINIGRIS